MNILKYLAALLLLTALNSQATAALQVGDRVRLTDQVGTTGGGEFGLHLKNSPNPSGGNSQTGELFRTFCIERNEYIDFDTNGFVIESISKQAVGGGVGGGNPDPISQETAWLFYNFTKGTLSGYLANDVSSANKLQNAIWGFENEIAQDAGWAANQFVVAANAASSAAKTTALSQTFVLNLLWATDRAGHDGVYEGNGSVGAGDRAQSLLYVVPEASAIAVWSGLSVLSLLAARRLRAQQA